MLGDGIVSLGVAVVVRLASVAKSSAKIGSGSEIRSSITRAGASNVSSPFSSRNATVSLSSPGWTPPSW